MASVVLEPPRRGPAVDAGDTPVQRDLRSLWPLRTVSARVVTNGTAPVDLWPKQRYGTVRPTTAQPIQNGSVRAQAGADVWQDQGNGQLVHNGRVMAEVDYGQYQLRLTVNATPSTSKVLNVAYRVAMPSVLADFRGDTADSAYTYGDLIMNFAHGTSLLQPDCTNLSQAIAKAGTETILDVLAAYSPRSSTTRTIDANRRAAAFLHYASPVLRAIGVTPHLDVPVSAAVCADRVAVVADQGGQSLVSWARAAPRSIVDWQRVLFQIYYTLHALHALGITHNALRTDGAIQVGALDHAYDTNVYRVAASAENDDDTDTTALRLVVGPHHVRIGAWDAVRVDRSPRLFENARLFEHYTRDRARGARLRTERQELIDHLSQPNVVETPADQEELHSADTPPPQWTLRDRPVALVLLGAALDEVVRADGAAQVAVDQQAAMQDFRDVAALVREGGAPPAVQQFAEDVVALPALALSAEQSAEGNAVLREQAATIVDWDAPSSRLAVTRRALPMFSLPVLGRVRTLAWAAYTAARAQAQDEQEVERMIDDLPGGAQRRVAPSVVRASSVPAVPVVAPPPPAQPAVAAADEEDDFADLIDRVWNAPSSPSVAAQAAQVAQAEPVEVPATPLAAVEASVSMAPASTTTSAPAEPAVPQPPEQPLAEAPAAGAASSVQMPAPEALAAATRRYAVAVADEAVPDAGGVSDDEDDEEALIDVFA